MFAVTRHHEARIVRQDERAVVCPVGTVAGMIRNQKPDTGPGVSQE